MSSCILASVSMQSLQRGFPPPDSQLLFTRGDAERVQVGKATHGAVSPTHFSPPRAALYLIPVIIIYADLLRTVLVSDL
jgi:hypothetical protein